MAPLICALLLTGCGGVYDKTKGWANRLSDWAETELETIAERPSPQNREIERGVVTGPAADNRSAFPARSRGQTQASREDSLRRSTTAGRPSIAATGMSRTGDKAPPLPKAKPVAAVAAVPSQTVAPSRAVVPSQANDSGFIVHLSSMRSQSSAHRQWEELQRTYPRYLRKLKISVQKVDLGERGVFYRVLAGPFPDKRTAQQVCSGLMAQKQYCTIIARRAAS